MQQNLFSIFLGGPLSGSRNATYEYVKKYGSQFENVVIPCAGRFVAAQIVAKAGVPASKIYCNDITLFSSAVGYYLADKPISDLKIQIVHPEIEFLKEEIDQGGIRGTAAILLAVKIAQLAQRDEVYYYRASKNELITNWKHHHGVLSEQLARHKASLHGMRYDIADARNILKQYMDDEKTLIYYNPPGFKSGYEKMFDINTHMTWNEPAISQISPEEADLIFGMLKQANATVLVNTNVMDDEIINGWNKIYAGEIQKYINRLLINKPLNDKKLKFTEKKFSKLMKAPYPLYDDFPITKNTKVTVVPLRREVGEYYRDMFIHRLGAASADVVFGFLLDGKLISVAGFKTGSLYGVGGGAMTADKKKNYVFEIYGMTIPSTQYKRISRLFMWLLCCKDFRDDFCKYINVGVNDLEELRTTCLSRLPEVRINHGILKLVHKELQKDKTWYLVYQTPFHNLSYKDCLVRWIDENKREDERLAKKKAAGQAQTQAANPQTTGEKSQ